MSYNNTDNNVHNNKRILCYNMITHNSCIYGKKCVYAHTLDDQKIDPIRHKIYTILKNKHDLSCLDLVNDKKLYDSILSLTKICSLCIKNLCPGGYNCRNGATDLKYKVCYKDLMNGNCDRQNCNGIHLTQRGLIPYIKQKQKLTDNNYNTTPNNEHNENYEYQEHKNNTNTVSDDEGDVSDSTSSQTNSTSTPHNNPWNNPPKSLYNIPTNNASTSIFIQNKNIDQETNPKGILLTENFLMKYFEKSSSVDSDSTDSDKSGDRQAMIEYLNNCSEDSLDESIFID